jgi:hypothetical protein
VECEENHVRPQSSQLMILLRLEPSASQIQVYDRYGYTKVFGHSLGASDVIMKSSAMTSDELRALVVSTPDSYSGDLGF